MASDILVVNRNTYFNVRRFEDSIANKGIERQKRIAVRKRVKVFEILLVIMIVLTMLACLFMCGSIVYENIKIADKNKTIAELEVTLDKKKFDNDNIVDDMKSTIKYDNLKMKAYLELNMITPTDKNVIYFDKSDSEYVRQYENIR